MAKPTYITDLETRISKMENRQEEFRIAMDNMTVNQAQLLNTTNQIHFLLAGTKYDQKNNGGLVGEIDRLKKRIESNTNWRIRMTAAGTAILAGMSFAIIKIGTLISSLRELIHK